MFPRARQVRHPHNVQRQGVLREPHPQEQERRDQAGHLLRRASDFLRGPVNLISSVPARRKVCARQPRPARFAPAVRRDPEVPRVPAVLPDGFRSVPAGAALDRSQSAVSDLARPVEFRKPNPVSRSTRASRPRLVDARPSKSVTQKASAGFIPFERARARLPVARMWKLRLRSSGNPAR